MPADRPADRPLRALLAAAEAALAGAGVSAPRVDAELLAAHVLGVPRGRLAGATGRDAGLDADQAGVFATLLRARAARVPLQHLLGSAPFRLIELAVGPGVFVPRPETEVLVDWGLARLPAGSPLVVDLCAGSGAIALSVAVEAPQTQVYAVERSPAALIWLRRNVAAVAPAVRVVVGDATDPDVLSSLDGLVDLVLCNPPYVPDGTPVEPEVRDHDPPEAVFGGPAGLDVISGIIARAAGLLRPGGHLAVEHDDSHGAAVPELLRDAGWYADIAEHRDLAGRPRLATGRRLADCTA